MRAASAPKIAKITAGASLLRLSHCVSLLESKVSDHYMQSMAFISWLKRELFSCKTLLYGQWWWRILSSYKFSLKKYFPPPSPLEMRRQFRLLKNYTQQPKFPSDPKYKYSCLTIPYTVSTKACMPHSPDPPRLLRRLEGEFQNYLPVETL